MSNYAGEAHVENQADNGLLVFIESYTWSSFDVGVLDPQFLYTFMLLYVRSKH